MPVPYNVVTGVLVVNRADVVVTAQRMVDIPKIGAVWLADLKLSDSYFY